MTGWMPYFLNLNFLQVDLILGNPARAQIALATLVDAVTGRIVTEPDLAAPYRLRVLGCDAQGLHPGISRLY